MIILLVLLGFLGLLGLLGVLGVVGVLVLIGLLGHLVLLNHPRGAFWVSLRLPGLLGVKTEPVRSKQ